MISAAPSASARAIADRMNSELTGWMIPSTVAVSMMGARSAAAAPTKAIVAINPTAVSSLLLLIDPPVGLTSRPGVSKSATRSIEHARLRGRANWLPVDLVQQSLRLGRVRIECEGALDVRTRVRQVSQAQIRVAKRDVRRRGIAAPD